MNSYYSFLICSHEKVTQFYFNGVPLGELKNGIFTPHSFVQINKDKKEIRIHDTPYPCPFESFQEMKDHLVILVDQMFFGEVKKE